jgi:hypothetical protein
MADKFFISTGNIANSYEPMNVVSSFVFIAAPAFGKPDFSQAFRQVVDDLARQAQKIGANGVIWINFAPASAGTLGNSVFGWGTAVRVVVP